MRLKPLVVLAIPLVALVPLLACEDDSSSGTSSGSFDAGITPFDAEINPGDSGIPLADAGIDAAADAADATPPAPGGALSFDGIAAEVELPTADGAANETAFTIEVWFKTTTATGTFFEVYGGGGADRFLFTDSGMVCFYVYSTFGGNKICTTNDGYNDGTWHYAAGTLGAVGGTSLYVDGVVGPTLPTVTSSTFNYDTNFRLGYGHTDINSALVYYTGLLDEVRVWSVERSASDIAANYRMHVAPSTAGLQGYWKLDETGTATTTKDETAGAHDGTLTNFVIPPSPWVVPGAF